ncbi:kinesin [Karstenula rhodostoma CBS 690.94]|uniref:Kinesin n=1 Tax=Karstenula rhodostoma CBS 690.94 TaxID=1392251 RepID=A0A9P4PPJ0_9PLEO|nr:kinesin [Karstenula rhodostoma CBS 690.94]
MATPPASPSGAIQRPMSAMIRPYRSSSRMSMSSKQGGSRASDDDSKTAVKVAVRVRPPLKNGDPGFDLVPQRFQVSRVDVTSAQQISVDAPNGRKLFVFDRVFGEDIDQEGVFDYVQDSVTSFVEGYNVSILAYGQSGAGKSFTMGTTGPEDQNKSDVKGIIPRAAGVLFEHLDGPNRAAASGIRAPSRLASPSVAHQSNHTKTGGNKNWQLKATYLEIYNEQLRDLLIPEETPVHERPQVAIREDTKGRILLTGLTQISINSPEDLLNALNFGSSIRQTDATSVNAQSSRSHAVFSLNLVQKKTSTGTTLTKRDKRRSVPIEAMSGTKSENWVTVDSKLHFVDLAGSERLKNTHAQGERAKEGISINAGLASLGKVISQLSSRSQGAHVSYRDSKLTRLLQDSLGGNAITYMIACVNPAQFHLSETLNTVQYAQRARAIQIKPQIQQVHDDSDKQAVIERLRAEVQFLRDQIRLSERTDRKKTNPQEWGERHNEREIELNNHVLDLQENYNALSARHAKLITELTKARDHDEEETPLLRDTVGDAALERLRRSNEFRDTVESVVMEYEQTIQSLEASLTTTRSSLASNESELLEKEARISILEQQTQSLQSRIQKAADREASNEEYVKSLEAQVDNSASGIEKNDTVITELREKLQKARENETSCEDYISTLEERLAENEQEVDLMHREIERLKHVVERQRSIGKLDNLLYELDSIRQTDVKGEEALVNGHSKMPSDPFIEKRSSQTASRQLSNTDAIAEEDEIERPTTAGAAPPAAGNVEDHEDDRLPTISIDNLKPEDETEPPQSPAQSRYVEDKLETVTRELVDLRMEHEDYVHDYETLDSKYQKALATIASLQDVVEEARVRRPSLADSSRSTSFLAEAGLKAEDGHLSSSRTLSAELSLAESGNTSTPDESTEAAAENPETETTQPTAQTESDILRELEHLKRLHNEKEERMVELNHEFSELQDQHQDTLDYVEELKSEVTKAQMVRPSSPGAQIIRRKSSQNVLANDRSTRAMASLRNIAIENFEGSEDTIQNFELNLTAIMSELHTRTEKVQELEAEIGSVKKDMEDKIRLINGLTKERSSLTTSSPLDISVVATMQEQLRNSEEQMQELRLSHAQREQELLAHIASLKAFVGDVNALDEPLSPRKILSQDQSMAESLAADGEATHQAQIAKLQGDLSHLQSRYEQNQMESAREVQAALKKLQDDHAARIAELEQATAVNYAARIAELEELHAKILQQVEEDAEASELKEKELQTHKSLVSNLEKQIEQHNAAVEFHEQSLEKLKQSHITELDKLAAELSAQQTSSQTLRTDLAKTKADMESLLAGVSSALDGETDMSQIHSKIQGLVAERKSLSGKMDEALGELESHRNQLAEAHQTVERLKDESSQLTASNEKLKDTVKELEAINADVLKQYQQISDKERKSSRLVQELEEQLNANFDQHAAATNRLSALQTERSRALQDAIDRKDQLERDVEQSRVQIALLESQLTDAKRASHRESTDPRENLQRSNSNSNVRSSTNHSSLPSPPPAIPLPPLPGSPPPQTNGASPPASRHQSKDIAHAQIVEDQEARIRTIEKHLFAEKQLTATLEDALTDLETSSQKTKDEVGKWQKKCAGLEQELDGLKKERSMTRHSLQAVEEERSARLRVEAERAHLEARMAALNNSQKKKKKAGGLNCF